MVCMSPNGSLAPEIEIRYLNNGLRQICLSPSALPNLCPATLGVSVDCQVFHNGGSPNCSSARQQMASRICGLNTPSQANRIVEGAITTFFVTAQFREAGLGGVAWAAAAIRRPGVLLQCAVDPRDSRPQLEVFALALI